MMNAGRVMRVVIGSLALGSFPACGRSAPDLDQVTRDQREIFFKLGRLERSIEQAATQPAAAAAAPEPKYPDKVYDIPVGGAPVKGPAKAPVTIVEFSDFQCPPCGEARALVKQIVEAYPKDVKLVYKQFPLTAIHNNAMSAAKAAIAAGRQGKFWEMHDILYQNQGELGTDKLTEYAGKIGLDVPRWVKDFSSAAVQEEVVQEMRDGRAADVDATPTFFVNGSRVVDRSFDGFKALIEKSLRAQPGRKG
jgi:protein-disulfide isomerase